MLDDIDLSRADDVLPVLPCAEQMLIHTGNIINRNFIYNRANPSSSEELKRAASKTLSYWMKTVDKHESKHFTAVDIDNNQFVDTGFTELRENLKVTAKLFVLNAGPESIKEALNTVGRKLNTRHLETVILSLPGSDCNKRMSPDGVWPMVAPYWSAAEQLTNFTHNDTRHHSECDKASLSLDPDEAEGAAGGTSDSSCHHDHHHVKGANAFGEDDTCISWTLGLADQSAESLEDIHTHASLKPTIDQINVDTCSAPDQLVAFCREHDIQLLTHSDPREILSMEGLNELMGAHFTHEKDLTGWRVGWILRYSALVKCRGIIHSKGYILSLTREGAPPNMNGTPY